MDPYTPPTSKPNTEITVEDSSVRLKNKSNQRWVVIAGYFCIILGVGLVASLLISIFFQNAKLDILSPDTTGFRAHIAIGALIATLICPILGGILYWNPLNYLIASTLAFGILLANIGPGLALALISLAILYGVQRLLFMLTYYKS